MSLAAGLAVYFAFVEPANVEMKGWTLAAPPSDWTRWRDRWEYGHAAHFVFHLVGFGALVLSLMADEARRRSYDHER